MPKVGLISKSSIIVLITVMIVTAVSVSIFSMSKASENDTWKIMRKQGLDLFLFPKGTETTDFFSAACTQAEYHLLLKFIEELYFKKQN